MENCLTEEERQKTDALIRPILRGRDIKRYGYVDNGLYLINTHNGIHGHIPRINIEEYPAIKAHLNQFWDKIANRADKGDTPYNLRNCAYLEDFFKTKITWGNLNLSGAYAFAPAGMFINAPSPFIATSNIAILHILNSKVADYYIRSLGVTRNGGYFEYKPMFVELFPIPKIGLEELARYPIQPTKKQEKEIEQLVYRLYRLSNYEIEYLDKHSD